MREYLHERSTLFGFIGSAFAAAFAGAVTQWSPIAMAIAGVLGIFVLPRAFYGWSAAKKLDDENPSPGSIRDRSGEAPGAYTRAMRDDSLLPNGLPLDPKVLKQYED
jgi:hypothetical protein